MVIVVFFAGIGLVPLLRPDKFADCLDFCVGELGAVQMLRGENSKITIGFNLAI
tara:strand:+ start:962 stop:1123 length:162 start_codon:yes stop_codon:yes gene_type:complete